MFSYESLAPPYPSVPRTAPNIVPYLYPQSNIRFAQIQQQARFEREETGNGSLNLAAPLHPHSSSGRTSADPNGSAGTSAFRTKILKLDEAALQDHGVLPADGGLVKGSHFTEQRSPRKGRGRTDSARNGTGIDGTSRRGGGGGRLSRRWESAVDKGKEAQAEWDEIPFSWIVRGRQESHLIDQQVRLFMPFFLSSARNCGRPSFSSSAFFLPFRRLSFHKRRPIPDTGLSNASV